MTHLVSEFPWKSEVEAITHDPIAYKRLLLAIPDHVLTATLGQFQTLARSTCMPWYEHFKADIDLCLMVVEDEHERRRKLHVYREGIKCRLEETSTADIMTTFEEAVASSRRRRSEDDCHDLFSALARMDDVTAQQCTVEIEARGKFVVSGNSPDNPF